MSQVCELLLAKGVDAYKKEGARYLQRKPSRHKKDLPDSFVDGPSDSR